MANFEFYVTRTGIKVGRGLIFNLQEATELPESELRSKAFNTPVFSSLEFNAGTYKTLQDEEISYDNLIIENAIMTLSQTKNVVMTAIAGRDGTIKEYVSASDYNLDIAGTLTNSDKFYPENEVRRLKKILDAPIALEVTSSLLTLFNIKKIVILDYNIPQQKGGYNRQDFTIKAISDVPFDLEENV